MYGISMNLVYLLCGIITGLFIAGLAVLVVYKAFTGKLNTKGLFRAKDGSGAFSFARAQGFAVTLFSAGYYFAQVLRSDSSATPEPPVLLLTVFAVSNGLYLLNKRGESIASS